MIAALLDAAAQYQLVRQVATPFDVNGWRLAANDAVQTRGARLIELKTPRGLDGFGLSDTDPQVAGEQEAFLREKVDFQRLDTAYQARAASWQVLGELCRNIAEQIAATPGGRIAQMVETKAPPLQKGEDRLSAVERYRRRARELKSDLNCVRAAPWPNRPAKRKMREWIELLAEVGRPHAENLIEYDELPTLPMRSHQVRVVNAAPETIGFSEQPDAMALLMWLHRDALVAALEREIDDCSDDKIALDGKARAQKEAEALADIVAVEREEVALIEEARAQGIPITLRPDTDARAVLSIEWVVAPPREPRDNEGKFGLIDHAGPRR